MREQDEQRSAGEEIEIGAADAAPLEAEPLGTCSQCGAGIAAGAGIATQNAVFCGPCYEQLTAAVQEALADQGRNINYAGALAGGLIGGALAAAVWWGFTVLTNIQFGLVAVLIGWAVGKGVVTLSGGKRSLNLQLISVGIALVSYAFATYLVNRTFILRYMAEQGQPLSLPIFPEPGLLFQVVTVGINIWDLVFVAIALYQAWKGPAPIVLRQPE